MIQDFMQRWEAHLRGELAGGIDELLHDDVVFLSPIVFSPQRGRDLTKLYLGAAGNVLPGDTDSAAPDPDRAFRYTKKVLDGNHAVLEFETWIGDTQVNGVDIITIDDDDKIIEFKVMIRPLQAINLVHANMKAMLEKMQG